MKRLERIEPLRGQFAEFQHDFVAHRARVSADITGAVRAAVVEQLEPMKETVGKAHGILVEQEARAKIKAEESKEKDEQRARRNTRLVMLTPIIVALITAWSAWVATRTAPPHQDTPHHEDTRK